MDLCGNTDEMDIFTAQAIKDVISYKWFVRAKTFHIGGLCMNILFTLMIILYVAEVYIAGHTKNILIY